MFFMKYVFVILSLIFFVFLHVNYQADTLNGGATLEQMKVESPFMRSLTLGGEWFLRNQNNDFLYYEYNLLEGEHKDTIHTVREMGALWSLTKLAHFFDDVRYSSLARKGVDFFENYFKYNDEGDFYYVEAEGEVKLAYSAFMILTFLEMEHPQKDFYLEKFARGILLHQQSDGSLQTFFFSDRTDNVDYYPGEALLALMELYGYTGDQRYLDAVKKAFPYYVDYWRISRSKAFIPWHTQAYYLLYQETKDPLVADFVFEMNDYLLDNCQKEDFYRFATNSVYLEGLNSAYLLARELHNEARMICYSDAIRKASSILLTLQVSYPYGDPTQEHVSQEVLGGFKGKDSMLRVDRNQHAVMALMGSYEAEIFNG